MARRERLTEEKVERLEAPTAGERTVWCPSLPRFGVRMRAGGTSKTFLIKYRGRDGCQRKLTLGNWPALSVDAARRQARRHLGEVERGEDPALDRKNERTAPTVADLAAEYMQTKTGTKRSSSLRDDRANWDKVILPALGRRRVMDVTAREIEALHRARIATPYRANRVLALLSNALALAVRWSWRPDNPVKGIQRFHEDRRERFLSGDELTCLVDTLNAHPNRRAANAVRLLLLTGARLGEMLSATWEQFDLELGVWTKPSGHTKQKRLHRVPLSAPALAVLMTMRREAEAAGDLSPYLFPGDALGKPLGDVKNFWRGVCRQAGIRDFRLHDLRHQYASMLASAGLSLPIIGGLLGHTQAATTARYAHLFDDPLRVAAERVGALVEEAGKGDVAVLRRSARIRKQSARTRSS